MMSGGDFLSENIDEIKNVEANALISVTMNSEWHFVFGKPADGWMDSLTDGRVFQMEKKKIDLDSLQEDLRDHSSRAGRIYARAGGVSEAVQNTVERLKPNRNIPLRATTANGSVKCKELLNEIKNGTISANFLEGMGCVGGCVGGPKALIDKEEGTFHVNNYGKEAAYQTPVDNPYVIELLSRLGFETIESLLEDENMFTRRFL